MDGYVGNPFTSCSPKPPERKLFKVYDLYGRTVLNVSFYKATTPPPLDDPCIPSPCGPNAECNNGVCSCISEYQGDPYVECRPECVLNSECPRDKACIRNKCTDPCPGTCAENAICEVHNHVPMCHCPEKMTGNAFFECRAILSNNALGYF